MSEQDEIRPIYMALQDLLTVTLNSEENACFDDPALWEPYAAVLGDLGRITGKNYSEFAPVVKQEAGRPCVSAEEYRVKVDRLVLELHRKYFSDEPLADFERSDRHILHLFGGEAVFKMIKLLGSNEADVMDHPTVRKSIEQGRKKLRKLAAGQEN
jgi:hypothetical protein